MPKRKVFKLGALRAAPGLRHIPREQHGKASETIPPKDTKIRFPEEDNPTEYRAFDFAPWYGKGIDELAYGFQRQIERFVVTRDHDVSVATAVTYCKTGARAFLDYCALVSASLRRVLMLADVTPALIREYLAHLRASGASVRTQEGRFTCAKTVLTALAKRGHFSRVALFPRNPFPHSTRSGKQAEQFTMAERKSVANALKTVVQPLFSQDSPPTGEQLAYCVLTIAMRTGRNTTPLLEMTVDCLRDHPLKPSHRLLVVFKRRGHKTHQVPTQKAEGVALVTGVLPDTERIVERLRLLTQPLREGAPTWLRNRLLIYESRGATQFGAIISLSNCALGDAVRKLVKRFDLTDSEGHPLKVNVSRMRKTFSGRIWEITKGDIAVTAAAAGHDPRIAGSHYLAPPVEAKKNWRFMGELLAISLATNFESTKVGTPAGKCADIRNGQFAPKNGEPCDKFMNCVRCREYVVTGDDLWRVFSFYWLVVRERDRVGKKRWARNYSHIVRIIDRDIAEAGIRQKKFSRSAVTAARERAKTHPHPYWADRAQFGELI